MPEIKKIYEIQNKGKGIISTLVPADLALLKDSPIKIVAGNNTQVNGVGTESSPYSIDVTLPTINGSETKVQAGSNVTVTGNGTTATPYIVSASSGATVSDATTSTKGIVKLAGDLAGTADLPTVPGLANKVNNTGNQTLPLGFTLNYVAKAGGTATQKLMADGSVVEERLQKTINANYSLVAADNDHIIFINNGSNSITITAPSSVLGLSKFECGFLQLGTGDVTFVNGAGATLTSPIGLKIKGQNYNAFIIQNASTNNFYLLGNLKP